ncbi:MAG: hypothetical protein WDN66_01270 [Candidatus Saccharibacteria bacterium]
MDVQFYGANCLVVGHKSTRIVIDDNLGELGKKSIIKPRMLLSILQIRNLVAKLA